MLQKDLYDLPIYRLPENKYNSERDNWIDHQIYPPDTDKTKTKNYYKNNPDALIHRKSDLFKSYGGAWRYNEIIGYLRLHLLGNQIRAELFKVDAKKIRKTRRKVLEFKTHKFSCELNISRNASSKEILTVIQQYIHNCQKQLGSHIIDKSLFENIAEYVNWREVCFPADK